MDIEEEWESIEEEHTVVTRVSEKGDEVRHTMKDGKQEQGEARDADEKDKTGEMKEKGETVEAEKTDVEEEKDKTAEMKEKEDTVEADEEQEKDKMEKTLKGKKNFHIFRSMLDCKYPNLPRGGAKRAWPYFRYFSKYGHLTPHMQLVYPYLFTRGVILHCLLSCAFYPGSPY